jgi:hypothetical protein
MDPKSGDVPESMGPSLVASTRSCVAVGTLSEVDGETTISLRSDMGEDGDQSATLAFDGEIETSGGRVAVCTTRLETILELTVGGERARVRIWVNHPIEPDAIDVAIDG